MTEVEVVDEVLVDRPVAMVWAAIVDPAAHAAWHPYVTEIRGEHREGAVRTCSVLIGGKAGETSERCIGFAPEQSITWRIEAESSGFGRMVSDWRSGFSLERRADSTLLVARSDFRPRRLVRVMLPLVRRRFHRIQREILVAVKRAVQAS